MNEPKVYFLPSEENLPSVQFYFTPQASLAPLSCSPRVLQLQLQLYLNLENIAKDTLGLACDKRRLTQELVIY